MEWVTGLQEISDSRAWPQRDCGLWFPFEYDNYDISSNRYYLLSSGLCESQYAGRFPIKKGKRKVRGRRGKKGWEDRERGVCMLFWNALPLWQVLLSPGMSQFTMVKMLACPQVRQEEVPGHSGIPRQSPGTKMCPFVVWLTQTWTQDLRNSHARVKNRKLWKCTPESEKR